MRFFGWSKVFEERKTYEDIPAGVRKTEIGYWIWMVATIVLAFVGIGIMLSAPSDNLKQMFIGLFIAIDGAISWAVVKIWAHIRLAMYWIIWDSQNRTEEIKN